MIAIRVDINDQIGMGHMMRCFAIASAIQKAGDEVLFICADEDGKKFAERSKFKALSLDTQWNDFDNEQTKIIQLIHDLKPKILLVDSYYATPAYFDSIHRHVRTAYLDDGVYLLKYPVDILINYNIFSDTIDYETKYISTRTRLVIGSNYAPLRVEFQNLSHFTVKNEVTNVLISTGGTDIANLSVGFVHNIAVRPEYASVIFHLVAGELNTHLSELSMLEKKIPNVHIHSKVKNMCSLIRSCDVAVSAGGTTLYELCACGIPTITYVMADNQALALSGFTKRGLMLGAGDCRMGKNKFYAVVCHQLDRLISNKGLRDELSQNMQRKVDGQGAERLSAVLMNKFIDSKKM